VPARSACKLEHIAGDGETLGVRLMNARVEIRLYV
jgi:hypothetical protein